MKPVQNNSLLLGLEALSAMDLLRENQSDDPDYKRHWKLHESARVARKLKFEKVIDSICELPWEGISAEEILNVALVYYYFSIQFRESLEIACRMFPDDQDLNLLYREECNTSNLSPWENVAEEGEAMNHDEFMRRLLLLQPVANASALEKAGARYLAQISQADDRTRAKSIASYEDGGLARTFGAMLRARTWNGVGQLAFKHFLERHIEFDTPEEGGHGALSRHLMVDDSILPLWTAFEEMLRCAVPDFVRANVHKG